ncbi:MAG TPA: C25 family cysteine peptidase, partial [Pirellulales bacterium]|nr:C25 family cysteine peptidase [Pirellulales bacterium]
PKSDPAELATRTPTFRIPSQINRLWGAGPEIATDNPYADLNDDGVPEIAIGRLTAHTPQELSVVIKKILRYEDSQDFGPWRARINFVAGEGGYGDLLDSASGVLARQAIRWQIPAAYQVSLTDARWRSPYCPDPRSFHMCSLDRADEGCLFWVFMGHGAPRTLQWAMFPDGSTPILQCEDCARLQSKSPPIMLLMCCYTGAMAESKDCLSEELLRAPGGPVAVFSGSSETLPYGMAAMSREAVREFFENHRQTLGEWILYAKRSTMAGYDLPIWALVHAVTTAAATGLFEPKEERLEHLQLFNLFGDPTMKMPQPREAKLSVPASVTAGEEIDVAGQCPVDGTATVELVLPWDQVKVVAHGRYDGSPTGRQMFNTAYHAANDPRLASITTEVHDGKFSAKLPIGNSAAGLCLIRVFVEGKHDFAMGSGSTHVFAAAKENLPGTATSAENRSAEKPTAGVFSPRSEMVTVGGKGSQ